MSSSIENTPLLAPRKSRARMSYGKVGIAALLFVTMLLLILWAAGVFDESSSSDVIADIPMIRYEISETTDPEALCNDGTRAAYYLRKAPADSKHPNRWIVRLEGGNICFDAVSCADRWDGVDNEFMRTWTDEEFIGDPTGGLLSSQEKWNPDWFDANAVHIHYCSSDGWLGDATLESFAERGVDSDYMFLGSHIVMGTFAQLVAENGMDSAEEILFAGFSAGGMAVVSLADRVADYLHEAVPDALVKGLCDSGWFMWSKEDYWGDDNWGDCNNYADCPIDTIFQIGWDWWNPVYPENCVEQSNFPSNETYKCLFAEEGYQYVENIEIMLAQHQYDVMHLLTAGVPMGDYMVSDETYAYAEYYREYIVDSLTAKGGNVWCSGCHVHDTTNHDWFTEIKLLTSGDNLATNLEEWFAADTFIWEYDDCIDTTDQDCNPTCPDVDSSYLPDEDEEEIAVFL